MKSSRRPTSDKLPAGWVKTTLADICLPVESVQGLESSDLEFTYFDIGGINNKTNRISETKTFTGRDAPSRARQSIQKNDILFSTVRTNLKNIALVEGDYSNPVASTGFAVIRAAPGVVPDFLFFQILTDGFLSRINSLQTGSSYPAVRSKDVFAQPVLLAPTAEQERIVAKLRAALAALDRGENAAQRAQRRTEIYRSTVLRDAVSGKLTSAWRDLQRKGKASNLLSGEALLQNLLEVRRERWERDELARLSDKGTVPRTDKWKLSYPEPASPILSDLPSLPDEWKWGSLDMVAEIGSGIAVSRNRKIQDPVEVPYLRVANVLLGRGWVWEGQIENCVHQNHVFRARLIDNSRLNPRFVSHWGNTFGQTFFIEHATQTTNLASINRSVLGKLPIPIPSTAEQEEIMLIVERRLAAAAKLESTLERQLSRASEMRQLVLSDAFSGRLVSQDDDDEPAATLVARLRRARDAELAKPKVKPMAKKVTKKTAGRQSLLDILEEYGRAMTPEQLFHAAGHSQDSVDSFFAELRELTASPARIREERTARGTRYLKASS